jgi:F420H(2)-dependent quinone reductase
MGVPLFRQEHVDRYRETDGQEGHDWQGTTVLLLTTNGRNSGAERTTPLIYQRHGDDPSDMERNVNGPRAVALS